MAVRITTTGETGLDLYADLQRLSDGFFWNKTTLAWEAAPAAADRKVDLTEGAASYLGSYTAEVAGLGDAGWVRVRIHDDADAADLTLQMQDVYVLDGNEQSFDTVLAAIALSETVAAVAVPTPDPGDVSIVRGDTMAVAITGLGNIAARDKLWFTAKRNANQTDAQAVIQIEETAGLVYFNGAAAGTPANGDITVDDAALGNITVTLDEARTAELALLSGRYDVQMLSAGVVRTLAIGSFAVTEDVSRVTA